MNARGFQTPSDKVAALARWMVQLNDEAALLAAPGARHKALLTQAYSLHLEGIIDRDDLSDLLEQADGALAYAVEALFDQQRVE